MINTKKKNNKGFTLVELLVVIAIIGILAVVAVPSLFKQINRAKAADIVTYMSSARTAAVSEYAATQKGVILTTSPQKNTTEIQLDDYVDDKPSDVEELKVVVSDSGAVTITINVTETIKDELEKQTKDSFGNDTIEINKKVSES